MEVSASFLPAITNASRNQMNNGNTGMSGIRTG